MRKLTKEQKRDIQAIAAKRDQDIDFSDAPAVLDWSGAEIGKFYRPTKKPVAMPSRFRRHRMAQSRWSRLPDQSEWVAATRHASLHARKASKQA